MGNVWIINLTGSALTLPGGTNIGTKPQQLDNTLSDFTTGITEGKIAEIYPEDAFHILGLTENMGGQPKVAQIQLTLPLAAGSIAYDTFKVLSRSATKRSFYIQADANIQNYCTVNLQVWDSSNPVPTDQNHFRGDTIGVSNVNHGYPAMAGSGQNPQLGEPGDTLIVFIQNGATANAADGVVTINIVESFS